MSRLLSGSLKTTPVENLEEVRDFFDKCAPIYREQHGDANKLLTYRAGLIKMHGNLTQEDVVLDIGCGPGHHLLAMAGDIGQGMGIDFSPGMIAQANRRLEASSTTGNISFRLDDARELTTVQDASIDVVTCVGALEHMVDPSAVLKNVSKVLKPRGRFVCLTPNGDYVWYRSIAPALGADTRHISTDRFLTGEELRTLLTDARFASVETGYWTFIPKGDMHPLVASSLEFLDIVGRVLSVRSFRGGLLTVASNG